MAERITIAVHPAQATDRAGDPIGDKPDSFPVGGVRFWPRTSSEEGRGEVVIDGLNLHVPTGRHRPVLATDQVHARGKLWDVEGVPGDLGRKGQLVVLKRVGSA